MVVAFSACVYAVFWGVLLLTTMINNRRSNIVPLWKSPLLALLYHGIDSDGVMISDVKEPDELEQLCETVPASLN
jgi:hypothetical protein